VLAVEAQEEQAMDQQLLELRTLAEVAVGEQMEQTAVVQVDQALS
jgi:hypothetical protein